MKKFDRSIYDISVVKNILKPISIFCGSLIDHESEECDNIESLSFDSNNISKGNIFIGIKGLKVNGGVFAEQALQQEARLCIIDAEASANLAPKILEKCIIVKDTREALNELAMYARRNFHGKIIGITGSIGKTTTKEMLKVALSTKNKKKQKIFATQKNYNSSIGVPLSLLQIKPSSSIAILEMGISYRGEMLKLSHLVMPEIAVITNINPVHIGHFNGLNDIAHAKSQIFESMHNPHKVILNRDNKYYDLLQNKAIERELEIITFGKHHKSDVRLVDYTTLNENNMNISVKYHNKKIHYKINEAGESFLYASIASLATAVALDVSLEECAENIQNFEALEGRGKIYFLSNKVLIIDDSYSSSPIALAAALDKLYKQKQHRNGRSIAILADMEELGEYSRNFHMQIKNKLEETNVDLVFAIGQQMKNIFNIIPSAMRGVFAENSLELFPYIKSNIRENDIILIKGSRIWQMDLLVKKLLEEC